MRVTCEKTFRLPSRQHEEKQASAAQQLVPHGKLHQRHVAFPAVALVSADQLSSQPVSLKDGEYRNYGGLQTLWQQPVAEASPPHDPTWLARSAITASSQTLAETVQIYCCGQAFLRSLQAAAAAAPAPEKPAEGSESLAALLDFEAKVSPSQVKLDVHSSLTC